MNSARDHSSSLSNLKCHEIHRWNMTSISGNKPIKSRQRHRNTMLRPTLICIALVFILAACSQAGLSHRGREAPIRRGARRTAPYLLLQDNWTAWKKSGRRRQIPHHPMTKEHDAARWRLRGWHAFSSAVPGNYCPNWVTTATASWNTAKASNRRHWVLNGWRTAMIQCYKGAATPQLTPY